jgi:hypothetical protein
MPKPYEGPPTTLADDIRAGLDIRAMCLDCGHSSVLIARELAARLGEGFVVRHLIGRLRCHRCRSKNADVMVYQSSRGAVAGHGPRGSYANWNDRERRWKN